MGKKKMKETEVVQFMKDEVERVTGLKCKVVPESNTWYDGFCLDTGNLGLHMFWLKDLEEHLLKLKDDIEGHNNEVETITLINNGVGRNLSRVSPELPFESE